MVVSLERGCENEVGYFIKCVLFMLGVKRCQISVCIFVRVLLLFCLDLGSVINGKG